MNIGEKRQKINEYPLILFNILNASLYFQPLFLISTCLTRITSMGHVPIIADLFHFASLYLLYQDILVTLSQLRMQYRVELAKIL